MVLSYVPFKRKVSESVNMPPIPSQPGIGEGQYENAETFKSRNDDCKVIYEFVDVIFQDRKVLKLEDYIQINKNVSSEMFYSLMRVLHEKLPCTKNFFNKRKHYRQKEEEVSPIRYQSTMKAIASPTMVRGLAISTGRQTPKG